MAKSYSFPAFYACYLLRSVQALRSYRNYIGSTRDPVRRLKQHNGLLSGGARETAAYRPWAMQLLVHGFPSRPAANTFEYAWQNPHKSRYLRDETGCPIFEKRGTRLIRNIMVLQKMVQVHPFSKWPLHVKIFTEEAVHCWNTLASTSSSFPQLHCAGLGGKNNAFTREKQQLNQRRHHVLFPPGFTCSVELEGVDGSSGLQGSGREGPVCVTDEHFTAPYLAKNTALIASGHPLNCSVCAAPLHDFASNHLGTTLCTHMECTSVSHLTCLAESWFEAERKLVSAPCWSPSTSFPSHSAPSPSTLHPSASSRHPSVHLPASVLSASTSMSLSSPAPSTSRCFPSSSAPLSSSPSTPISTPGSLGTKVKSNPRATSTLPPFSLDKGALPRGGTCISCGTYTLWGDIIKGCYRRHTGFVSVSSTLDDEMLEADEEAEMLKEHEKVTMEGLSDSGSRLDVSDPLAKQLELLKLEGSTPRRARQGRLANAQAVTIETPSNTTMSSTAKTRGPGRPRKLELEPKPELDLATHSNVKAKSEPESEQEQRQVMPRKRGRPKKLAASIYTTTTTTTTTEGNRDLSSKPRRGRPRKNTTFECMLTVQKGQHEETIINLSTPSEARRRGAGAGAGAGNTQFTVVRQRRGRPRRSSGNAGGEAIDVSMMDSCLEAGADCTETRVLTDS